MNLVEVATWIQEAYRAEYDNEQVPLEQRQCMCYPVRAKVLARLMRRTRGKVNPNTLLQLIALEDSVPDSEGKVQC